LQRPIFDALPVCFLVGRRFSWEMLDQLTMQTGFFLFFALIGFGGVGRIL